MMRARAWCAFDVEAVDEGGGGDGIGRRNLFGRARNGDGFVGSGQAQGNMQHRFGAGSDDYGLGCLGETGAGDADGVLAERNGDELELPVAVRGGAF